MRLGRSDSNNCWEGGVMAVGRRDFLKWGGIGAVAAAGDDVSALSVGLIHRFDIEF